MTERRRLSPDAGLEGLSANHRDVIAKACLDESIYSPSFYAIEVPEADDGTPRGIEALHVGRFGRFGNLLIQIGNALDVAKFLGVETIFYDVEIQGLDVFESSRVVTIDGVKLISMAFSQPTVEKTLFSTFWSLHSLFSADIAPQCRRDVVPSRELYALLDTQIRDNLYPMGPHDIVAHFRGGDVFQNDMNLDYVQPPFAFYRNALTEALDPGAKVHIVCEDRLNPAVDAIIAWLEDKHQAFEIHSGALKDDLKVVLAAHHIVSSYGTFVSANMKISPNIRTVFLFDNQWIVRDQKRFRPDVLLKEYEDSKGEYTKHGQWTASDAQIKLIVDYDIASIVPCNREI